MKLIYDIIPSLKEIKNGKIFKLKRIIDLRDTTIYSYEPFGIFTSKDELAKTKKITITSQ